MSTVTFTPPASGTIGSLVASESCALSETAASGAALPEEYHRYFRIWFAFGIPGFGFTIAILWLMIAKPF
jgi:uncharacterized membrane protein